MIKRKLALIAVTLGFFWGVQGLGLWVAWWVLNLSPFFAQEILPSYQPLEFLSYFILAAVLFFLVVLRWRLSWVIKLFLGLAILVGALNVFITILPVLGALGAGFVLLGLFYLAPNILVRNLSFAIAVAGVGAPLGLALNVAGAGLLLFLLSVYDVIATAWLPLMGRAALQLASQSVFPGLIVPVELSDLFRPWQVDKSLLRRAPSVRQVGLLGGGDLAFPLVFAVSVFRQTQAVLPAVVAVLGAGVGLVFTQFGLYLSNRRRPVPALPVLAFFELAAFALYQLA